VLNAAKAIHNAELRETLLQKEKLSAVGKAMSMMMHDLRSPVKNIKAITQLMRDESKDSEMLDMIDECAGQASQIFDDFLDFVKETPVMKSPVNLGKIVDEGIKLAESRNMNGQVSIRKKIPANLIVAGDESKLKRSIMNLVKNGIDALGDHKSKNPQINIIAEIDKKTSQVVVTVHDNGPGIPDEIIKKVFEPFVTKKKVNGTGLGLAIVKQYITAHGGEIKAENQEGAVFTINLPLQ